MDGESPFKFYDRLKESQIFRFLKLIGCSNQQVGEFAKFVKRRNKIAHPTGTVFFNDQTAIDAEVADMMKEVRNIEAHMQPVILYLYRCFLSERADEDGWEFAVPGDEVQANLVHANYMSAADLAFCRNFNIDSLSAEHGFGAKKALHQSLLDVYPAEELTPA